MKVAESSSRSAKHENLVRCAPAERCHQFKEDAELASMGDMAPPFYATGRETLSEELSVMRVANSTKIATFNIDLFSVQLKER